MQREHWNDDKAKDQNVQGGVVCLHAFSDLSHTSPAAFIYLLKECYLHGTLSAKEKFDALQGHVTLALHNGPRPGPATFIVQCLYVLPLLGKPYTKGFSQLLMNSLHHLKVVEMAQKDFFITKHHAARLFVEMLSCSVEHEEKILIGLLKLFDIELKDIGEVRHGLHLDGVVDKAKAYITHHINSFIESASYGTAVDLSIHFSMRLLGDTFFTKMLGSCQFKPAEKWATFMGKKPMFRMLVQKYLDAKMLTNAYDVVKKNDLKREFPDVPHLYKESMLKKSAEEECWDVAELWAKKNKQLIHYLVYLALEYGYVEKVQELCGRYSLDGFVNIIASDESSYGSGFLDVNKLLTGDIIWVDEIDGLLSATKYLEACKVVGLDCEWEPNCEIGSRKNRVSIIQIASEKQAFVFDLIKLYEDEPKAFNSSFKRIFWSSTVLKIGYNLQCDLKQLLYSYGDLECFRYYKMILDIQKCFREPNGGLSGLAKKVLGAGLDKTLRCSDWGQRPLTQNQMKYAALDAVVLLHLFRQFVKLHNIFYKDEQDKRQWKSHIEFYVRARRKSCVRNLDWRVDDI